MPAIYFNASESLHIFFKSAVNVIKNGNAYAILSVVHNGIEFERFIARALIESLGRCRICKKKISFVL